MSVPRGLSAIMRTECAIVAALGILAVLVLAVAPEADAVSPEGISLPESAEMDLRGNSDMVLEATVLPEGCDCEVVWESSNPYVAAVGIAGGTHALIGAVSGGQAVITASIPGTGLSASCVVTVESDLPIVATVDGAGYQSLRAAMVSAGDGGTVTLVSDVTSRSGEFVMSGCRVTLDLNGFSVRSSGNCAINNQGDLTVVGDGLLTSTADGYPAVVNYGKITVRGGTFVSEAGGLWNQGEASVEGGVFTSSAPRIMMMSAAPTVGVSLLFWNGSGSISGGEFDGDVVLRGTGDVGISGGAFAGKVEAEDGFEGAVTVTGGTFSEPVPEEWLPEDFSMEAGPDGAFVVKRDPEPIIPPSFDDDDYYPLPPTIIVEDDDGDDHTVVVAAAACAVVAVLIMLLAAFGRRD